METFFIKVFTAVLTSPEVEALLTQLFGDALDVLRDDLKAELAKLESGVITGMEALPGEILGDATKDVGVLLHEITGTTTDIAGAVKGEVQPLLPTVDALETMFANVIKQLPGGNMLGGFFGH